MSRPTRYPRRDALRMGGLAVAVVAAAPALTSLAACAADPTTEIDRLRGPAEDARRDAALATRLAEQSPDRAEALTAIADQRTAHAAAVTTEIERLTPRADDEPEPPEPAYPAEAGEDVETLVESLRASAEGAQTLVSPTSGYRSGLLGSIAAACTAQAEVLAL